MKKEFKRFDMTKKPIRTRWYLRPIIPILAFPAVKKHKSIIKKIGTEGLKPPYIMLCNHNSFLDFKVASAAIFPHRANYVVAIDGFIGREWLLRNVGCICKRKFTNDILLIKQLKRVINNGDIAVIYPEARYSLCGTTAVLPESLGKLCKNFGVPVVTFMCHGHHITSPFWNLHPRNVVPTEAEMTLLYTPEQLKEMSVDEINAGLVEAFRYNDFEWQKQNDIKVSYKGRAEGLHKVLYQCPHCKKEYEMFTKESTIGCNACGKTWSFNELGEIAANEGETEFTSVPEWYEWERANVRAEIESGSYSTGDLPVTVDTLPNAKKFIRLGNGILTHDMNGFTVRGTDVDGDPFEMLKPVPSLYSCHIEYDYLGKGADCIDLNTLTDTWYIYPHGKPFAVTKMALATEELYFAHRRSIGKPCPPGLA